MKYATLLFVAAGAAVVLGCFTGNGTDPTPDAGGDALPCDVAQALSQCQACHGSPLAGSAPFALTAYQDLTQTSPQYSDQSVAQRVVARMSDPNFPMPPNPLGPVAQADIDTIQAWIDAGFPSGTCTPDSTGGTNPFATDPVCTQGMSTINFGSKSMLPGEACVSCHKSNFGPSLAFAGTVYPTAHEPNDCKGTNVSGAVVQVTDAMNRVYNATVNTAGNFYAYAPPSLVPPYTVKVTYQGRERDMTGLITAPTDGDCNKCHTETGDQGAPGRILLP